MLRYNLNIKRTRTILKEDSWAKRLKYFFRLQSSSKALGFAALKSMPEIIFESLKAINLTLWGEILQSEKCTRHSCINLSLWSKPGKTHYRQRCPDGSFTVGQSTLWRRCLKAWNCLDTQWVHRSHRKTCHLHCFATKVHFNQTSRTRIRHVWVWHLLKYSQESRLL